MWSLTMVLRSEEDIEFIVCVQTTIKSKVKDSMKNSFIDTAFYGWLCQCITL